MPSEALERSLESAFRQDRLLTDELAMFAIGEALLSSQRERRKLGLKGLAMCSCSGQGRACG